MLDVSSEFGTSRVALGKLARGGYGRVVSLPVTIQCAGNRLREVEKALGGVPNAWTGRTSGYGQISTATFEGVRLADVLEATGVFDGLPKDARHTWHVVCRGRDGYENSASPGSSPKVARLASPRRRRCGSFKKPRSFV